MNESSPDPSAAMNKRHPWSAADISALILAGVALAVFCVAPVRLLCTIYSDHPNYSHGYLVPLVAMFLAWRLRSQFVSAEARTGWGGLIPLAAGCGMVLLGHWYRVALHPGYLGYVFLQGIGLLIVLWSVVWILLGPSRFRVLAPVMGFLVFAIPLPESLTLPITTALQRLVAVCSTQLLRAMGVEVFRDGNLLHLHSMVLGVAEACSGIRSLMAYVATAAACGIFLKLGLWRTLLLLALAPVAAVGSNILRILVTSFFVLHGGTGWLHGPRHDALGLAVILLGGGFLFACARFLNQGRSGFSSIAQRSSPPAGWVPRWPSAVVVSALLFAAVSGMLHITRHYGRMLRPDSRIPVSRMPLEQFPVTIGPFRCTRESRLSRREYDMLLPSEHLVRSYEDPQGNWVLLTVLYWEAQLTYPGSPAVMRYPHTPYSCMWGAGWTRETAYDSVESPEWLPDFQLYTGGFVKPGRERIVLFWNTNAEEDPRPFSPKDLRKRWRILVQSWSEVPEGILPATYSVRIETDIGENPDTARNTALDFARQTAGLLPDFGIGQAPAPRLSSDAMQ